MASRLLFISLVCSFIAADQVELFEGGHNDWKRQTHTGTLLGAWLCHLMYRIHWSKRCYTIYLCAYCHVIQGRERAGFSSRFFFFSIKVKQVAFLRWIHRTRAFSGRVCVFSEEAFVLSTGFPTPADSILLTRCAACKRCITCLCGIFKCLFPDFLYIYKNIA